MLDLTPDDLRLWVKEAQKIEEEIARKQKTGRR